MCGIWFLLLGITEVKANSIPYRLFTISDGLPHENIQTIAQTPDGRLWVGTSAGLSYYTGAGFVPVRFSNTRSTVNVHEVQPLENDEVWVATHQLGVWQIRYNQAAQPFAELKDVRASRLVERGDTLHVFGQKSWWKIALENESIQKVNYRLQDASPENLTNQAITITSADVLPDGSQWVLDLNQGPGRVLENGQIQFVNSYIDEGWYAIRFDESGTGWVTHEHEGLYRLDTETGEMELVIAELGVRHICVTPEMIVVTSYNKGALYWSLGMDQQMPSMNVSTGLPTNQVNCIYRDHEGNGWIGTQIGLIGISQPGVKHLVNIDNSPLLNLKTIYNYKDNTLWANSLSEGLFQLSPQEKSVTPDGERRWFDLFLGYDNRLHALGGNGWYVHENDTNWTQVQPFAGGYRGKVDQQGNGYFMHLDGVYKHQSATPANPLYNWPADQKNYHHHTLSEKGQLLVWANGSLIEVPRKKQIGVKPNVRKIRDVPEFTDAMVSDMVVDYLGRTWISFPRLGLLCVDEKSSMRFLQGYHIENLSLEGDSLLIANAREGLLVFNLPPPMPAGAAGSKKQMDAVPDEHLKKDEAVRYHLTQSDGLMSSIVAGAAFTPKFLWVTHPGGVSKIPRKLLTREAPVPQVLLTRIDYNGIKSSPFRKVNLTAADRNISFEFSATTYSHAHRVEYRYRLKGHDNEQWRATKRPYVQFSSLPAGKYEFEVQAATDAAQYGKSVLYDFEIPVPYYQLPVFWMAMLILMMVLTYMLHLYRLRSMLQVERTRTQIAMDLHDDIGSSLTSLSFLSNLALERSGGQGKKTDISPLLTEIGSMSSELVDNMLDIVWSVDPKQDSVGSVAKRLQAFYQRIHNTSDVSIHWQIEESVSRIALPPRPRRNLYLILKEAINNAIKHSDTPRVEVQMTQDLGLLHVTVRDSGKGFDVNSTEGGYGLNTMRERAEECGATFEIRSSEDASTLVYIRWPLRKYVS